MTFSLAAVLSALRVHQWVKNVLVFVPLVLAHRIAEPALWFDAAFAFLAFGLCASSGYVVNDVADLEADRNHVRKRHRPFAAGRLGVRTGVALAVILGAVGIVVGLMTLSAPFAAILIGYVVVTLSYTFKLKHIPIADVLVLAGLYTLRLGAGAVAVDVPLSPWTATFAMFLFLSLAFVKRHSELVLSAEEQGGEGQARGYRTEDLSMLQSLGPASGYLSVLVLALYINSSAVTVLYPRPHALWLLLPVLLYWMSRLWFRANRGQLHDDPIVETTTDPVSYVILAIVAVVVYAATV